MRTRVLPVVLVWVWAGCFAAASREEPPYPAGVGAPAVRHKAARRVAELESSRPAAPVSPSSGPAKAASAAETALAQAGRPGVTGSAAGTGRQSPVRRLVIYTASVAVQVSDLEAAAERVKETAEELGGYVQLLTAAKVVVRVPARAFYRFLAKLSGVGEVYEKEIRAQDVTREFLDLELRLKAKMAVLERLQKLLERAQNVKDAMAVQREMGRLVEEIERIKGQLRYLRNLIAFSTVTVRLRKPVERHKVLSPPPTRSPFPWIRRLGISPLLQYVRR